MYRVRIKNGGSILVLGTKDMPLEKELNFTEKEYAFVRKLSEALHCPDERVAFWRTLLYKKSDINYSVFSDFPEIKPDRKNIASEICNMLRPKATA